MSADLREGARGQAEGLVADSAGALRHAAGAHGRALPASEAGDVHVCLQGRGEAEVRAAGGGEGRFQMKGLSRAVEAVDRGTAPKRQPTCTEQSDG